MIFTYDARSDSALCEYGYLKFLVCLSIDGQPALHFCWIKKCLLHRYLWSNYLVNVASLVFTYDSPYDLIVPDLVDEVAAWTRNIALWISAWLPRFANAKYKCMYEAAPYFFFISWIATSL